jgi:hypothetical protein
VDGSRVAAPPVFNNANQVLALTRNETSWNWKGASLPTGGVEVCESEEAQRDGCPAGG